MFLLSPDVSLTTYLPVWFVYPRLIQGTPPTRVLTCCLQRWSYPCFSSSLSCWPSTVWGKQTCAARWKTSSVCLSEWIPASSSTSSSSFFYLPPQSLWASMRLSVSGQGITVGVVWKQAVSKGLWANSCTSRGSTQKQPGQVRPQSVIRWPGGRRHEEEQLCLSEMVDIGFGICCLPSLCA